MNNLNKAFLALTLVLFTALTIVFPNPSKAEGVGMGTGFFIDNGNYIVTNEHVIKDARTLMGGISGNIKEVYVIINNVKIPVLVVKEDAAHDLALLQVPVKQPVSGLPLASVSPQPGETLCAVGHPLPDALDDSLAIACGMAQRANDAKDETQDISISIAPGNSGSPVVNNVGEVIGVAEAIKQEVEDDTTNLYVGQSVAIDLTAIKALVKDIPNLATKNMGGIFNRAQTPAQLFQETKDNIVLIVVPE